MAASPVQITASLRVAIDTRNRKVDPYETQISKAAKHEAEWHCVDPKASAVVKFVNGRSPFSDKQYAVPAGDKANSGEARPDATEDRYPYEVFESSGTAVQQNPIPGIIIIKP